MRGSTSAALRGMVQLHPQKLSGSQGHEKRLSPINGRGNEWQWAKRYSDLGDDLRAPKIYGLILYRDFAVGWWLLCQRDVLQRNWRVGSMLAARRITWQQRALHLRGHTSGYLWQASVFAVSAFPGCRSAADSQTCTATSGAGFDFGQIVVALV